MSSSSKSQLLETTLPSTTTIEGYARAGFSTGYVSRLPYGEQSKIYVRKARKLWSYSAQKREEIKKMTKIESAIFYSGQPPLRAWALA
jgi:hypothetical protein